MNTIDSSYIAENDNMRSDYMCKLIHDNTTAKQMSERTKIARIIVQYWHDLSKIPDDVQECLNSWDILKKRGYKRALFDDTRARKFISNRFESFYVKAYDLCHHPAMRCDYFRLCYIVTCGGFYVDADEIYKGVDCNHLFYDNRLKIQPLCYDIASGDMVKPESFMIKREYSPDWIFYVNNNPLIAPANHPVIRLALNRATRILLSSKREQLEIQATTGPGNLTASLVKHSIESKLTGNAQDFMIIPNWEEISNSPWPLSYRNDKRNWRLWNPSMAEEEGWFK